MNAIKAIGFDLFDTLIVVKGPALRDAMERLITSLKRQGFIFEDEEFINAYREAAREHIQATRESGRETHNRFWISSALEKLDYFISSEDPRIAVAVEHYFQAFNDYISLIPDTLETLTQLKSRYRLGLLSNFTHPPAAYALLKELGLDVLFEVILISGELGFRKPHPRVFRELCERLQVLPEELIYVGDNPEDDIQGALRSGIQPVWMKYSIVHQLNFANRLSPIPELKIDEMIPAVDNWEQFREWLQTYQKNDRTNR
ncbi:MAG: HAD family hydrolase [Calditrichaeota bacterium]|nr:MAG: HAD family hydrolase [Calditrichota bacterium]